MPDHHYDVGDRVEISTREGGSFTGVIVGFGTMAEINKPHRAFVMDGTRHVMVVMPDSADLVRFLGGNGTYQVGGAHWDQQVRLRDA